MWKQQQTCHLLIKPALKSFHPTWGQCLYKFHYLRRPKTGTDLRLRPRNVCHALNCSQKWQICGLQGCTWVGLQGCPSSASKAQDSYAQSLHCRTDEWGFECKPSFSSRAASGLWNGLRACLETCLGWFYSAVKHQVRAWPENIGAYHVVSGLEKIWLSRSSALLLTCAGEKNWARSIGLAIFFLTKPRVPFTKRFKKFYENFHDVPIFTQPLSAVWLHV